MGRKIIDTIGRIDKIIRKINASYKKVNTKIKHTGNIKSNKYKIYTFYDKKSNMITVDIVDTLNNADVKSITYYNLDNH